jgi:hypothetical protein
VSQCIRPPIENEEMPPTTRSGKTTPIPKPIQKPNPLVTQVVTTNPEEEKVRAWLQEIGLQQYGCDLIDNGFDTMRRLTLITPEDLQLMKITKLGHVRDILNQVRKLNSQEEGNVFESNKKSKPTVIDFDTQLMESGQKSVNQTFAEIFGGQSITIKVRILNGDDLLYRVNLSTKIENLMISVRSHLGYDNRSDRTLVFLFEGHPIDGNKTFHYLGIEDGDVVDIVFCQGGGKPVIMIYGSQDELVNVT